MVGVGSLKLSNTLMRPLFSATNTWPFGAMRTAVGTVRPLHRTLLWKSGGSAFAATLIPSRSPVAHATR